MLKNQNASGIWLSPFISEKIHCTRNREPKIVCPVKPKTSNQVAMLSLQPVCMSGLSLGFEDLKEIRNDPKDPFVAVLGLAVNPFTVIGDDLIDLITLQ